MFALCLIVTAYQYVLFGRVIVSFAFMFRPDWSPRGPLRGILETIYALTDPPVNFLRRYVPPLRSGAMALDLAFIVWALIVYLVLERIFCQ